MFVGSISGTALTYLQIFLVLLYTFCHQTDANSNVNEFVLPWKLKQQDWQRSSSRRP